MARRCRCLLAALLGVAASPAGASRVSPQSQLVTVSAQDAVISDASRRQPESEEAFAEELAALSQDPVRLSKALFRGMGAVSLGLQPLLDTPVDDRTSLQMFETHLWEVVLEVVPKEYHMSDPMTRAKVAWEAAFTKAPDVDDDVRLFREAGDTDAIVRAVQDVVAVGLTATAQAFITLAKYFDAILDLVDSIGQAWALHCSGQTAEAVQEIWSGVKSAVDEVLPPSVRSNRAYNLVMGSIDGVVADLNRRVLDSKRHLLASMVCYKRTLRRRRSRPAQCHRGFEWDGVSHCIPDVKHGANCWEPCGNQGGWCPSFCGKGKVCCKQGSWWDPPECRGATGYKDFNFTIGSGRAYHQCVKPESAFSLAEVQQESRVSSLDRTLAFKNSKQYGYHLAMCNSTSEFSDQNGRWCLAGCPEHFVVKGTSCEQTCSEEFPVDVPSMCGTSKAQLTLAAVEFGAQLGNSGLTAHDLIHAVKPDGVEPKHISETVNSFVELGKQFLRPLCPMPDDATA